MTRLFVSICLSTCLLALLPVLDARAVEMPTRKAGLWEMKVVRTGSPIPEMTSMQHCTTDESTRQGDELDVSPPMAKDMCSKQDIQKTATGYVSDSVCNVGGMSITSHSDITGDFKFRLHGQVEIAQRGRLRQSCRVTRDDDRGEVVRGLHADQKAGDIVMPVASR